MNATIRHPMAVGAGAICICATIATVFGDVRLAHLYEDLSLEHLWISIALFVAVVCGHYMWIAFKDGGFGYVQGTAFTISFIVGTIICVSMSGGRGAAILEKKETAEKKAIELRSDLAKQALTLQKKMDSLELEFKESQAKAQNARDAQARECATGKKIKCEGTIATTESEEAAERRAETRYKDAKKEYDDTVKHLVETKAEKANAWMKALAKDWAPIVGYDSDTLYHRIKTISPYLLTLLIEFTGIWCLNFGFGPEPRTPISRPLNAQSLSDIAREIGIEAHAARKHVRALGIVRPEAGWVFQPDEARDVKQKLLTRIR